MAAPNNTNALAADNIHALRGRAHIYINFIPVEIFLLDTVGVIFIRGVVRWVSFLLRRVSLLT